MRTGIILASALMLAAVATSAQASPLMPAAPLAGVETHDGVVLARHRVVVHVKKARHHPRHYGWIRGQHKGWYKHKAKVHVG